MATTDRTAVNNARTALNNARTALIDAQYLHEMAIAALKDAERRLADAPGDPTPDLGPYRQEVTTRQTAHRNARDAERAAVTTLQNALTSWIQTTAPVTNALTSAEEDIGRLESTAPIVLLPVRLETRFVGNQLKVRVFPDGLFLNTHEAAITEEEFDWVERYYTALNEAADPKDELEYWRDIVARFGVERSAYLLRRLLPTVGLDVAENPLSCGATLIGKQRDGLAFPQLQQRAGSWTRPGEALLPDRWMVVTYQGNSKRYTLGQRIVEPLAMTPDPKSFDDTSQSEVATGTEGPFKVDEGTRWTVDYNRALQVGMAINVDLQGTEATTGFDRVIVLGVKSSLSAADTSRAIEKLLDGHHYTRGVALVRQGSATNNTGAAATPFPQDDPAGQHSFYVERRNAPIHREVAHNCMPRRSDGDYLARAIGVPNGVFAHVDRSYGYEIERAKDMNRVLWPGTLGYFMQQLMVAGNPGGTAMFNASEIDAAGQYFGSFVVGRGVAPAFRVGSSPYAVLPVCALNLWQVNPNDGAETRQVQQALFQPLRRAFALWLSAASKVPVVAPLGGNATATQRDAQLLSVLSRSAQPQEFWFRPGQTPDLLHWGLTLLGLDSGATLRDLLAQTESDFASLALPGKSPMIGAVAWDATNVAGCDLPAVADTLSESDPLAVNYVQALVDLHTTGSNGAQAINEETYLPADAPKSLLREMLRRALLAAFARKSAADSNTVWTEFGLFGVGGIGATPIMPRVYAADNGLLGSNFDYKALEALADLPSAELDRLFRDTLDVSSRRLDAWVTSYAAQRLDALRTSQVSDHFTPTGDFLGGYAWLTDVRPLARSTQPITSGNPRVAELQAGNGGHIHAPSMTHATAAALLRNAHLNATSGNGNTFAVDLSSRRVRRGRELFEGVRNGQPVGALLGYKLERALRDNYSGLDQMRMGLRNRYPLVANKSGVDNQEQAEAIAARNVIDGEAILLAYQAGQLNLAGDPRLPAPGTPNYLTLTRELDKLLLEYDAAADLLTAEAVYQFASGNRDATVPTLNNLVDGRLPPDSVISQSARTGVLVSHRAALVFHRAPTPAAGTPGAIDPKLHPRAAAEPVVNAWVEQLVGDASQVYAQVAYWDADEVAIPTASGPLARVTLADLGLRGMDWLAIAEVVAGANQGSMLDRRIVDVALADPTRAPQTPAAKIQVDYLVPAAGLRTFPQVLEVLHTASGVIQSGRPLNSGDLVPPAEVDEATIASGGSGQASATARAYYLESLAAADALEELLTELTTANSSQVGMREALLKAAHYLPQSAYPDPTASNAVLRASVVASLKELTDRHHRAVANPQAPERASTRVLLQNARERYQALFGESFIALPPFEPVNASELDLALASRASLLKGDEQAPDRYLQQVMRMQPRMERYRRLNLYSRAFGMARPRTEVVQLPYVPGEPWLGLANDPTPEAGRSALLLLTQEAALDPLGTWSGVLLDNWNDTIPNKTETTGVAVHYQGPQAQAPQAVLVAVPAKQGARWSFDQLLASVEQTYDLMRVRALETAEVGLQQLFPPLAVGENPNRQNTVSTAVSSFPLTIDNREPLNV